MAILAILASPPSDSHLNPCLIARPCMRAGTPFALDEIVMEVWEEQERFSDWWCGGHTTASWFQGVAIRPFDRWVQGERSLLRVLGRRYGPMARQGSMPKPCQWPGGCNGGAQRPPCQDCGYYPAHLANNDNGILSEPGLMALNRQRAPAPLPPYPLLCLLCFLTAFSALLFLLQPLQCLKCSS
ncbi:hypothetical protein SAMN02745223_02231 [Devosia limi DSM 17137]|uniref:Uncharacterized protein n=1 Tax=Devosia limi DSM 17137 TaxID=1121477 RepID=A0A1M5AFJ1_9HYPH|nr:hypothetical protein SAMN02745223_02231 [Devosia limi DSM 17137]